MAEPVIARSGNTNPIAAIGHSFEIHEWTGSGPGYLHVHFADDEAWYILEGALSFRFGEKIVVATAGTAVFVPAGVPHDYFDANGTARYLVILTPRLHQLIDELHKAQLADHAAILKRYESAIVE
jgi:mannose-6-phosphate isomerase-like protein (cupin superfamily)